MSRPDLPPQEPVPTEPVFAEPWHAQAFALALALHERGRFAWPEFADELAAVVAADPDGEYYASWLTALERVVVACGLTSAADLVDREEAWHRAARATPHGAPISLGVLTAEPAPRDG
ncbi:nitrile hydratase accessory protein [Pseudonocardia sp. KRD291]|uniref:nitrile hydratase accessory protein n=1 Tax=Pseudonocardia sp. KRD291 TaxID=2792007 RepID=UPI001C49FD10|nr:nitrile hydratase accessory protein [Pseudonocardia sp. KRD291]MBW0106010.1 nitrile hydratase accessory protein [Pseudonocardia sp. KRD291]